MDNREYESASSSEGASPQRVYFDEAYERQRGQRPIRAYKDDELQQELLHQQYLQGQKVNPSQDRIQKLFSETRELQQKL